MGNAAHCQPRSDEGQEFCDFATDTAPNAKMVTSLKRKIRSELKHTTKARKKAKTVSGSSATIETLPWRTLSHTTFFGNTDDDGILELEEVDNVQVVYEEMPEGKLATFKVRHPGVALALALSIRPGVRCAPDSHLLSSTKRGNRRPA